MATLNIARVPFNGSQDIAISYNNLTNKLLASSDIGINPGTNEQDQQKRKSRH